MEPNGKKLIGPPTPDETRYQDTAQNSNLSAAREAKKYKKNKQCQCASISPFLDHNGPCNLDNVLYACGIFG